MLFPLCCFFFPLGFFFLFKRFHTSMGGGWWVVYGLMGLISFSLLHHGKDI